MDQKGNISYLDKSAAANAGKFSIIRSLKRLSLWPASTSMSFTLVSQFNLSQLDPQGVAFNSLESHTNNLLTFFVFFGQGGDSDLSLSSSELLLPLTPSVTGEYLIWSDLYLTLHAALEQRALNFIMTWQKMKRFALLHFSNEKEHCMYSFKMFFLPILPVIHIHIRNYRKGLINNK